MGQPALRLVTPEFGDGDGPSEATQLECPNCGSLHFLIWDSLEGECVECGQEIDLDVDDDSA